jgi:hypothetical protein
MTEMRPTVVGVFPDRSDAERAIQDLHLRGFDYEDIGFAIRGATGEPTTMIERRGELGAAGGSGIGDGILAGAGIGGLVAAGASLLIPGFGPVIAGGILATILGGAAIGAAAGGLIGALTSIGVPEEHARYYESELEQGRVLVTVDAHGRDDEAREIFTAHGAYDVDHPVVGDTYRVSPIGRDTGGRGMAA